jgi:diguanylate cyclase (GGDEF)-like protein
VMATPVVPRRQPGTALLLAAYAVSLMLWIVVRTGAYGWWSLPVLVPAVLATLGCLWVARYASERRLTERIGWLCLGLGVVAWAIGRGAGTAYETLGAPPVLPALAAHAYLFSPPLLFIGLVLMASERPSISRLRLALEAIADCVPVLGLCWYFVLRPLGAMTKLDPDGRLVALAYPWIDVGVCFWAIVLHHSRRDDATPAVSRLLSSAVGLLALADMASFWLLERLLAGMPVDPGWNDAVWGAGFAICGAAALQQQRHSRAAAVGWQPTSGSSEDSPDADAAHGAMSTPRVLVSSLLSLGTAGGLLWHSYGSVHRLEADVSLVAFGLVSTMLLRQLLVLAENSYLSGQLRLFNRRLEQTVQERTRQLGTLHEIARAANASLEIERVIDGILHGTSILLQADATAIWFVEPSEHPAGRLELLSQLGFDDPARDGLLLSIGERWTRGLHVTLQTCRSVPVPLVATACGAQRAAGGEGNELPSVRSNAKNPARAADMMCASLQWQGKILGVLGAVRWRGQLGDTERALLEAVALEVALALQNARLYHTAVQAADRDFVTGLFNHRAIVHHLEREFQTAQRHGTPLAILVMDLDNFKLINDTHGHVLGDRALKCVAAVLRETCRPRDIVGRYGGDEFVALCPATDVAAARALAATINERLGAAAPLSADGRRLPLSIGCGLAVYPEMAQSQHELLALADMNLYESKISGGSIVGGEERADDDPRSVGGFSALDALVTAVDKRDRYTRRHSEDVTEYSLMIAEELGLSEDTTRTLRLAGLLHDLGKIGIPDAILRKPGRLTDEEHEVMKQHPVLGWLIVSAIPNLSETLPAIRHHHERYDGRGYPDGLAGEEIPLLGRLMAVADAFSAMTTDRPYRKGMPYVDAVTELRRGRGTQWDPEYVDAFLRALGNRSTISSDDALEFAAARAPAGLAPVG